MLLPRRLATIFIIVVLLDPSQIESEGHRRTRDHNDGDFLIDIPRKEARLNREDKLTNNADDPLEHARQRHLHERHVKEKSAIHHAKEPGQEIEEHDSSGIEDDRGNDRDEENRVEVSGSRLEDDEGEGEGRSGDERHADVQEINHHTHQIHSREDSKLKVGKRLDQHRDEGDDFGYITDENDTNSERDDEASRSGERHHHVKKNIAGEGDRVEQSGKEEIYEGSDLQTSSEWKEREASLLSPDEEDSSGARDLPEVDDSDEIPEEENDGKESERSGEEYIEEFKGEDQDSKEKNVGLKGAKDKIKLEPEKSSEGPDSKRKEQKTRRKNNEIKKPLKTTIGGEKKIEQIRKPLAGKKGSISVDKTLTQNHRKVKVHTGTDLSQEKNKFFPRGKTNKKTKSRPSNAYRDRQKRKTRRDGSKSRPPEGLLRANDFYIDEINEPVEKLVPLETDEGNSDGEFAGGDNKNLKKRAEDGYGQKFRMGNSRRLLQFNNESDNSEPRPALPIDCIHPLLLDAIKENTIIYIRAECRLCHCKLGQFVCNRKPDNCDEHPRKPCTMANGQLTDGERHSDGCNNCICRNGELLCTRLRCFSSNYNYTNYQMLFGKQYTPGDPQKAMMNERLVRGKDPCMECDDEPVAPVCGPNWKTYRSMCHALRCGGFTVDDVKGGKCGGLFACIDVKCGEHQICVADKRGPCLTNTDRDGNSIECPQHQCVSTRVNCSAAPKEVICGEDQKTYTNRCTMFTSGISLAYYGQCKLECYVDDEKMCGVDGVTFKSICHASVHNNYVDYPGMCDDVDPKYNIDFNKKPFHEYVNPRCKTVEVIGKCAPVDCQNYVIPEGSCCPVCGTAVSIRLDTAVRDMAVNDKVQPLKDLNRVDPIFLELKNLSDRFGGFDKCQLTADLVDTHDISVVFKPIKTQDLDACKQVAEILVAFINSPAKSELEPTKAMLAVAVLKDRSRTFLPRAEYMMAKRRKKRSEHHEHEPFYYEYDDDDYYTYEFSEGNRKRIQLNLLFLMFSSLFCSTNLIFNCNLI